MTDNQDNPGPINTLGSFTGEFGLGDALPMEQAPYVIERDRIVEGQLPGFGRKLLPVKMDEDNGERTAGGYYLLDTFEQARYMFDWYRDPVNGFVLDGIPMLQRAYFIDPAAHHWHVIGAHDFKSIDTGQKVVRFERWRGSYARAEDVLANAWPDVRDEAGQLDLATVWLLFNPEQEDSVGLVTASAGSKTRNEQAPDLTGVRELAQLQTPAAQFEQAAKLDKCFDRTSLIYSIWFPWQKDAVNRKTLWPNSPPLPGL